MSEEAFRSRLQRLRRETGRKSEDVQGAGSDELPIWFRRRAAGARKREAGAESDALARVGLPEPLEEGRVDDAVFACRRTELRRDHRHGEWSLAEVEGAEAGTLALVSRDGVLESVDLSRAVYLDTETTGLSGGAGVQVFMIGLGCFTRDGFELWQGFLRSPAEERALLAETARRLRAAELVVSFFGKSFDRHRLEDKMRICGVEPPFDGKPHLDLYHPCRRLFGSALPDARLRTMEASLCGVTRTDDLPGSQAPAAWFDLLAGRPHRVEDVFRHNADDVLSLVTLTAQLGRLRAGCRTDGRSLFDADTAHLSLSARLGLARLFFSDRPRDQALAYIDAVLPECTGRPSRELAALRADALRLLGRPAEALCAYRSLCHGRSDALAARCLVELAKLQEHHAKDFAGAIETCDRALRAVERHCVGSEAARLRRDLERRAARLQRRLVPRDTRARG